jgi:hypothetical protein
MYDSSLDQFAKGIELLTRPICIQQHSIETNLVLIKIGLLYEISTLPQTAQLLLIKEPTNVV